MTFDDAFDGLATGSKLAAYSVVCDTSDRPAWLVARRTGIGASEIAIIMGASRWGSNVSLYFDKIGEVPLPDEPTEIMELGLLLEPVIRDEVARRAGVTLLPAPSRLLRSVAHPWALATCDALTSNGDPVEVKNLSYGFDAEEWTEQIPEKYFMQCQQQMLVTGANRCLFGALVWGNRIVWEWVERDDATIAEIIAAGSAFWGHVLRAECPPSDGQKGARKALAAQATDLTEVELFSYNEFDRYQAAAEAHVRASMLEKRTKVLLDQAKDALAMELGTHMSGHTSSGWVVRWKITEKRGYTVAPTTLKQLEIKPPKA